MSVRPGSLRETAYTPKLAGVDDLGSSLITLEVDLAIYRENLRLVVGRAAPAEVIAVVKANAYGFGVAGLIPILSEFEQVSLGVATPDEALELRANGYDGRIILLGYTHPSCYYQIALSGCELAAYRRENIALLVEAARAADRVLDLHIKVDTGLTRLGVAVDELPAMLDELRTHPELRVVGLFSHLADSGAADNPVNFAQAQAFDAAARLAADALGYMPQRHLGNSGALLNFPPLHYEAVRVGILPFGILPPGEFDNPLPVEPCYTLRSEVIDVHSVSPGTGVSYGHHFVAAGPTRIATLPYGYADGLPRSLSGRFDVLIGGRRCRQVGAVTMDYIMADLGDADARIGDSVVLLGRQGDEQIRIEEHAELAGTIPYEISCAWGRRVRRAYTE